MNRIVAAIRLVASSGLVMAVLGMHGQLFAQDSGQTVAKIQSAKSPSVKIEDLAWIAGHWSGKAMGGDFEETWNPPMSGSMMGMFKFATDGKIQFYEILTIVPKDESLVLRLKHFDAQLKGWEEKDQSVEFPLLEISENKINFDGLVFERIDQQRMNIRVLAKEGDSEARELLFQCKRVKKSDQ